MSDINCEMLSSAIFEESLKQKRLNKRKLEDDESSEAENSDNDLEETLRPAKKKIRVSEFILDEAEVFDDDEASDDDKEESDFVAKEKVEKEGSTAREVDGQRRLEGASQINESKLLQHLEYKYSKPENNVVVDDKIEDIVELNEASRLPMRSDPYFWLVKCRLGSELETVLLLTRKCLNSGLNLQVTSILLPEGTKGWIFVEAHKEGHVRQLIEGVSALAYDNKEIRFIPKDDMPKVMKSTKESVILKPKQFVRIAKGHFKGDLAEVIMVDSSKDMVHLKLFPRIDYTKSRGLPKSDQNASSSRKMFKPPQKAFDSRTVMDIGGKVKVDGEFTVFEGNRYKDGFIYKIFPIDAVVHDGVQPTEGELQKFKRNAESSSQISNFEIGDNVEVINHAMAGLKGRIVKKIGLTITIQSKSEEFTQTMDVRQEELKKYFNVGDQVKVLRGVHQGNTGMVVLSENDVVIFISDANMSEIRVSSKDVQLCGDVIHTEDNFKKQSRKFSNSQKDNFSDRCRHTKFGSRCNPSGWKGNAGKGKLPGVASSSYKRSGNIQRMDLIGKVVKVVRGNYKSYTGYVKKASDELAVLQLFTDGKIISIATGCLALFEVKAQASLSASKLYSNVNP